MRRPSDLAASPQIVAWSLYYDGSGGLKEEAQRRLMVLDQFLMFGYTRTNTGVLAWTVTECIDHEGALAQAIHLTQISETWGLWLHDEPHVRTVDGTRQHMHEWLNGLIAIDRENASLDALYERTMREGVNLARAAAAA